MIGILGPLGTITDLARGEAWPAERLRAEVLRRAASLIRHGARPGRHVIIAHGGTPAFFADLFAVWRLGACAVCTDPGLTKAELENVAAFAEPAAVLVEAGASPPTLPGVPVLDLAEEDAGEEVTGGSSGTLDDPALILFTSGTTGTPKGVVHTFRSLLARIALNQAHIGARTMRRSLCVLPTHFGHGLIGNCLTPLLAGGDLWLWPNPGVAGAGSLGKAVSEARITFMSSVPAFWKLALRLSSPPERPSLERVHVGSAPLSREVWSAVAEWSGAHVANMYGITETANWIGGASSGEFAPADGLLGRPWGGSIAVRDGEGTLRARGEGEIVVQTPSLMQGYFRRPDLTGEVLERGWLRTGDLGHLDEAGRLWLTGRAKNEINRAGLKVQPEEIDLLLERHPDVAEACAFGVPDETSGELVGVAVRLTQPGGITAGELRTWCRERLRRESVPDKWFIVEEIPKTDRGKVNRARVLEFCLARGGQ